MAVDEILELVVGVDSSKHQLVGTIGIAKVLMFKFKGAKTAGYKDILERARRINAIRQEIHTLSREPMMEFSNAAALGVEVDREIDRQRSAAKS